MKRPLKLSTPREVRQALTKTVNEVRSGQLTPQQGNAIITGCNVVLSSIRADEQEKKIAELEILLKDAESSGV